MILVDTSAWIEWLIDSATGAKVAEHLPEQADWLVPTMVQLELAKWLTREVGVAAIPLSAFCADGFDQRIVRFCFAKNEATLEAAVERLRVL